MSEIIVDSFAGGGGASLGIEMALGRSPDVAINHDADALAMHAVNHPQTRHLNSNIWTIDPAEVEPGRPIGLLWASPDCKHHSKAKGGKPLSRNIRDLAWVVVLWAQRRRPRVICLENVEEFRDWGPLGDDDRPIAARRGETFRKWVGQLRKLGYRVEHRDLRACDYGAPTIRKRLFLIARCDGAPIVWPAATHGDPRSAAVKAGRLAPWRTAAEIIDWAIPCPSIFLTREEGRALGCNRPLAQNTLARIAKGVQRYVIEAAEPFIVPVTHAGDTRVHGIGEPLRTVTTAPRGEHAVVAPSLVAYYGKNAQGGDRVASVEDPLRTVVTENRHAVVAAHLTKFNTGSVGAPMDAPSPTVTANSFIKRPGGAAPIGLVAAHLTKFSENSTGVRPDEPLHTVMAGAPRHGVVAAFLAQHNGGMVGHGADEPVSTIVQKGCTQAVVETSFISRQFGQSIGSGAEEPIGTVTAGGGKSAEVRAFLVKYYGEGGNCQSAADPLHTVPSHDRFGLVTVQGVLYEIADIGMRMLRPRELFRAQGFPDSYVIDRRPDGSALTGTASVRMCGNSVSPVMARALVAANYAPRVDATPGAAREGVGLFREAAE
jgi:DNA (cytosine-5)-methyltransferase 1